MPFRTNLLARVMGLFAALFIPAVIGQTNGVLREVYNNISGGTVSALTNSANFPSRPSEEYVDGAFEAPSNFSDNYGQRMRALVQDSTGDLYIAVDKGELWRVAPQVP